MRNRKRSPPETWAIRLACRASGLDVPECVGAGIAEALGIRRTAYAEGIQNEKQCARHAGPFAVFCPKDIGGKRPLGNSLS